MTAPYPELVTAAGWLLWIAFFTYVVSATMFASATLGGQMAQDTRFQQTGRLAGHIHLAGLLIHLVALVLRGVGAGHWPTSNMYEFIGAMAFTSMLAFQVVNRMYSTPVLGALATPVGIVLLAYAYVFPPKVTPLVPALHSIWLSLHVSMTVLGEGFFAVGFGAALLYLLRARGIELAVERGYLEVAAAAGGGLRENGSLPVSSASEREWSRRLLEWLVYLVFVMVGFTLLALSFRYAGLEWAFSGGAKYHLPPIIGPSGAEAGAMGGLPLLIAPDGWHGKNMNTLLYSLAFGGLLYWLVRRFIAKGVAISDRIAMRVSGDPGLLDEISYRTVAIGFPIFTLGGLVFAMIWAKQAWGRYWFWDPKETWAFITWCVYALYLHLRISRGATGRLVAWVVVLGFLVALFTLIGVNLLIVGLHSYAGGDA